MSGDAQGAARADALLRALTRARKTPGLQYIVVNADRTVFEHDSGSADLGRRVPMAPETTMMAYSMSKTITAVAVLQLVEQGRVGLDHPVAKYVDGLPYDAGITVRQLIAHTSGLPNPIPLRWVHPVARHAGFDEAAALAAVLRDHPKMSSRPGEKYRYSNIGYWLLGHVVERASSEPFTSYVAAHVLHPLGLTAADLGYAVANPSRQATGYLEKYSFVHLIKGFVIDRELIGGYSGAWLEIRGHYLNGPAFGGLVGTARGFARFLQDQLRGESVVLGTDAQRLLYEQQKTNAGKAIEMTLGWHIGTFGRERFFFKEGGGGGFHCMMRVYPASSVGTVMMTNATGFNVRQLLDRTDVEFLNPN